MIRGISLVEAHGDLLRGSALFAGLDGVALAKLAARLEVVQLDDGENVVRHGEPGDALYVISRGQFGVYASDRKRLLTCGRGELIGEMALLTGEPRSATVRAETWVVGGVASPRVALGGFASGTWMLTTAIFVVGAVIASSGLLFRVALWSMEHVRGGFKVEALALCVTGWLSSAAVPNPSGRMLLVAPAVTEMAEAYGYAPGSRPAAGLAMAALLGFGQTVATFLTSSTTTLLTFTLLPDASRSGVDWMTWAVRAAPTYGVLLIGMLAFIVWRYAPQTACTRRTDALPVQRALLGPVSRQEWVSGVVMLLLLASFATQPVHHIDPAWIAVAALGVLARPRAGDTRYFAHGQLELRTVVRDAGQRGRDLHDHWPRSIVEQPDRGRTERLLEQPVRLHPLSDGGVLRRQLRASLRGGCPADHGGPRARRRDPGHRTVGGGDYRPTRHQWLLPSISKHDLSGGPPGAQREPVPARSGTTGGPDLWRIHA